MEATLRNDVSREAPRGISRETPRGHGQHQPQPDARPLSFRELVLSHVAGALLTAARQAREAQMQLGPQTGPQRFLLALTQCADDSQKYFGDVEYRYERREQKIVNFVDAASSGEWQGVRIIRALGQVCRLVISTLVTDAQHASHFYQGLSQSNRPIDRAAILEWLNRFHRGLIDALMISTLAPIEAH